MFFLTREKERYLLHQGENPKHCVKHKSHIMKVIFLCAVARPHFNTSLSSWWDRKLGIWPIGEWEPAKRKTKNRPKGMLAWKNKIVMKEFYRDLLIRKLNPAILENWLPGTGHQGKFSFSRMEPRITFVRMTSCSMMHWKRMEFMRNSTH